MDQLQKFREDTTGKVMTMDELSNVQGRPWEDIDVCEASQYLLLFF